MPNYKALSQSDLTNGIKGFGEIADRYVSTMSELVEYINVKLNLQKDIKFLTYAGPDGKLIQVEELG